MHNLELAVLTARGVAAIALVNQPAILTAGGVAAKVTLLALVFHAIVAHLRRLALPDLARA